MTSKVLAKILLRGRKRLVVRSLLVARHTLWVTLKIRLEDIF